MHSSEPVPGDAGESRPRRAAALSDYPIIRAGLRVGLERAGVASVRELAASIEAVKSLTCDPGDLVVLEVGATPLDASLAICSCLAARCPAIVLLGVDCIGRRPVSVRPLLAAGLQGYVSLSRSMEPLATAVSAVQRGETVIQVARAQVADAVRAGPTVVEPAVAEADLGILALLAKGMVDREVGKRLGFSECTVKRHVEALERAHGLRTRFHIGAWAGYWGIAVPLAGDDLP